MLAAYVSDLVALEKHLSEALDRQTADRQLQHHLQAKPLLDKLRHLARVHREGLDLQLRAMGGHPLSAVTEAATAILGVAAGMLDKVRPNAVSKMLRDDYTALSLAAVSYTMLHTAALAFKENAAAELARRHLQDWTPLIVEISEVIPAVIVKELELDSMAIEPNVAAEALKNTHEAWTRESMDKAA
jgi:hypothetical protein